VAAVKALRQAEGESNQTTVPFEQVADYLVDQIVGGHDHDHDHDDSEHVHYHH